MSSTGHSAPVAADGDVTPQSKQTLSENLRRVRTAATDIVMANNTVGNNAPDISDGNEGSHQGGQGSSNSASDWLAAVRSSKKNHRDGSRKRGHRGNNKGRTTPPPPPPAKKTPLAPGTPVPRCTECGKKGHKSPECWSIIGRPSRQNANVRKAPSQAPAKEQNSSGMVNIGETNSKKRHRSGNPTGETPDPKKQATSASAPSAAANKLPYTAKKVPEKANTRQRRRFDYAKVTQVTHDVVVLTKDGRPVNSDGLKEVQEMINMAAMKMVIQDPDVKVPDVLAWDLRRLSKLKGSPFHAIIRCGTEEDQQKVRQLVGLHEKYMGELPEAIQPIYPRKMSAFATGAIMSDEFYSTALDYGMRQAGFSPEDYIYLSYDKRDTGASINIGCTEELISRMESTNFQIKLLMMGETKFNVWKSQEEEKDEDGADSDGTTGASNIESHSTCESQNADEKEKEGGAEGGQEEEQTATAGALNLNQPSPPNPTPSSSNSQKESQGEMEVDSDQMGGKGSATISAGEARDTGSPLNPSEVDGEARDQTGSPNSVPK